jgi:hypothetical protein
VKQNQRLDYGRLAEVLAERGLVEPQALREALQFSGRGGLPFPEALVTANLVADWELSRVVCELYNLPFVSIDQCDPDPKAREGVSLQFLLDHGLVPIGRFGRLLSVVMPALVPAEVLGLLAAETELQIVPLVGTVRSNRRWLEVHLQIEMPAALPSDAKETEAQAKQWSSIFDAGDAAVLLDLQPPGESDDRGL